MQRLKQILEEIEKEKKKSIDVVMTVHSTTEEIIRNNGRYDAFSMAEKIIRKHMKSTKAFEFDFSRVQSFNCECGRRYINTANDDWIPIEEALPETDEIMLVTCRTKKGQLSVNRAYYFNGFWHGSGSMSGVIAWQPLPDPYEPERSEA